MEEIRQSEEATQILILERSGRQKELSGFVAATCAGENAYFEKVNSPLLPQRATVLSLGVWDYLISHTEKREVPSPREQKQRLEELEQRAYDYLREV
jgi:hypothetical protein